MAFTLPELPYNYAALEVRKLYACRIVPCRGPAARLLGTARPCAPCDDAFWIREAAAPPLATRRAWHARCAATLHAHVLASCKWRLATALSSASGRVARRLGQRGPPHNLRAACCANNPSLSAPHPPA